MFQIWRCRIEELAAFKEENGHCNVEIDYASKYYDLGLWCKEQRILYQRHNEGMESQLDQGRMDDLEQLGFDFEWKVERSEEYTSY